MMINPLKIIDNMYLSRNVLCTFCTILKLKSAQNYFFILLGVMKDMMVIKLAALTDISKNR